MKTLKLDQKNDTDKENENVKDDDKEGGKETETEAWESREEEDDNAVKEKQVSHVDNRRESLEAGKGKIAIFKDTCSFFFFFNGITDICNPSVVLERTTMKDI